MTTIAWDGKNLAADTLVGLDGSVYEYKTKIEVVKTAFETYQFASCGQSQDAYIFIEWLKSGMKDNRPHVSEGFCAILIINHKQVYQVEHKLFLEHIAGKTAIGSGWMWAKAALDLGKNAIEAVEYAITKDLYSGGEVHSISV